MIWGAIVGDGIRETTGHGVYSAEDRERFSKEISLNRTRMKSGEGMRKIQGRQRSCKQVSDA